MPSISRSTILRLEALASELGIESSDMWTLRRIAMTLHRWHEQECGDSNEHASWCISRDETTNKPYREVHMHHSGKCHKYPIRDMEGGALRRLVAICHDKYGISFYVQPDPRGATLYLSATDRLDDTNYSSKGRVIA